MAEVISLVIPGLLRGKQRARATRMGRVYTPNETRNAEAFVKMLGVTAMQGDPPLEGPLTMSIAIFVSVPASFSKKKQAAALAGDISPAKKPDLDNCVKLVCDALNGVVYKDDCQVVSLVVTKIYAPTAETFVAVGRHTSSPP